VRSTRVRWRQPRVRRQAQQDKRTACSAHGELVEPSCRLEGQMSSANSSTGIAGAELFRGLSKAQLDRLERVAHPRHYEPGAVIVQEGQGGIAFFIVVGGRG